MTQTHSIVALATLTVGLVAPFAEAQDLVLEADVPTDAPPYFEVPFEVPEGVVEIEVRHDDLSETNILDWGLRDPERVRGWGGGNDEPAIVGADAASRSYLPGPIQAGTWAVLVGQARVEELPARYRLEIFFRTVPTLPADTERMPYVPASALSSEARWYAGDFHVHSRESGDARATLDEAAQLAADRGLDFIELSEHNTISHVDLLVAAQERNPTVLLVPGLEVTTYDGHGNAIGVDQFIDFRVASGLGVDIESIIADTTAAGGLFAINHPVLNLGSLCIGCAWELGGPPEAIDAVEVQNGAYSVTGTLFYTNALAFWDRLLDEGSRAAAIGGSDDHRAGMELDRLQSPIGGPTTMVFAEELTVAAILEGIRAGRTVLKLEGPDDPMVELFADDQPLGSTVDGPEVTLRVVVTGTTSGTLQLVRNGEPHTRVTVDADPFETTLVVSAPYGDVDDRWRAQLNAPTPRVVTSHVWVRANGEDPPPDMGTEPDAGDELPEATGGGGCDCHTAPGRGTPTGLLVAAALLWGVRRRRESA